MQTHKALLLALSFLLAVSTAAAESATKSSRQHGHVRHRKSKKSSKLRSTEAVIDPTESPIRAREPVARAIEVCFSNANTCSNWLLLFAHHVAVLRLLRSHAADYVIIQTANLEQELEDYNVMQTYDRSLERVVMVMPLADDFDPPLGHFGHGHLQTSDRISMPASIVTEVGATVALHSATSCQLLLYARCCHERLG
jgi:hypothetical protein